MPRHATENYVTRNKIVVTVGQGLPNSLAADYAFGDYASPQAAIQAAIDNNTTLGATVVINSSCTITGVIRPKSNVDITSIKGVVITWNSGHIDGLPVSPNPGFHAIETSAETSNFNIYGLSFNGGFQVLETGVDGAEYQAIYIRHGSHNFTISDIYGTRTGSGVVRVRDNCHSFTLKDITAFEADAALIATVGCHAFTIDNIHATKCFAEGLYLGSGIYDFNVSNIYAEDCHTRGLSINNDYTPEIPASDRANVSNVNVYNSGLQGVYLVGCKNTNFVNINDYGSSRSGLQIQNCQNINIENAQIWNSNRARVDDGTSQYSTIQIYDSKHINILNATCDDDGDTKYQYRGINSAQSVAGATDYIKVIGGSSHNTVSASSAVVIGNNSTCVNHGGYNPRRYRDNGNVGATPSILLKNGDTQRIVLTQNSVLQNFDTNAVPGQKLTLIVVQNSTGGHTLTFPGNTSLLNGAWNANTDAGSVATITFEYVSSALGWYEVSRGGSLQELSTGEYLPKLYVYLPDYKPQAEIDAFITNEVEPKGKFWGVFWENFRFNTDGSVLFVDTTESGGSNMGFSSDNKTRVLNIADNILAGVAGDVSGSDGVTAMLASGTLRDAAINDIVTHVTTEGFKGVNINFEPISDLSGTKLTNFRTFITGLRAALNAEDPTLILTWAGQIAWDSDQPNKEYSGVNYTGEANMSGTNLLSFTLNDLDEMGFDIIEMQAYDQFYDFGAQEFGITSMDQVSNAISFAHSRLPRHKFGMILSSYGVRMDDGTDVYGAGLNLNNATRAQITSADATFYSTATRDVNRYLRKSVSGSKQILAADQHTIDVYYNICKNKQVEYIGFWLAGDYYYPSDR